MEGVRGDDAIYRTQPGLFFVMSLVQIVVMPSDPLAMMMPLLMVILLSLVSSVRSGRMPLLWFVQTQEEV